LSSPLLAHARDGASASPLEQAEQETAGVDLPPVEDRESYPVPAFREPHTHGNLHPEIGKPRGLPQIRQAEPDTVIDGADFAGLTVRAASLRGDDHRYYGETRQDSMGLWTLPGRGETRLLLVCVADGVGSQPLSHRGSRLACRLLRDEVSAYAEELFDHDKQAELPAICERIAHGVARGMSNYAADRNLDSKALSTTLVAAIIELTPANQPRPCIILRVGDSTAYLLRDGAFQSCLADAHHDEAIVSSATDALPTQIRAVDSTMVEIFNDDVLLVCTDGLDNPMRSQDIQQSLVSWWSRGRIPSMLEFCWQLSIQVKSHGDDRTAVCVWGR
jgi:serine/threonine protein phosphatase PrpC